MDEIPDRVLLRWHGGKYRLREWINAHLPPHRIYCELFGGGLSVFFAKPRSYGEVVNDLDDEVVNLYRVVRDPASATELRRQLELTPFARTEFRRSYGDSDEPIESARRLIVRSFMGFGSNAHASGPNGHRSTGFRSNTKRSGTTPAKDWINYPAHLDAMTKRLRGAVIENRDAFELMSQHDSPATLFYADPPYMWGVRAPSNKYDLRYRMYRHEMSDVDHARLLEALRAVAGMVVLSGYATPLYDDALGDWRRVARRTYADGARPRTEVLWINPAAADALDARARGHGCPLMAHAEART